MAGRNINHTGRETIEWELIDMKRIPGATPEKDKYEFAGINFSSESPLGHLKDDAVVWVEPYYRSKRRSIKMGTVGEFRAGTHEKGELDLRKCEFSEDEISKIQFRIKVTAANHLILASADQLNLRGRPSLLRVRGSDELGDEPWQLEIGDDRGDDETTTLLINTVMFNKDQAFKSSEFKALVYPTVLRQILTHILTVACSNDADDLESTFSSWLRFGEQLTKQPPPEIKKNSEEQKEIEDWIEEVVKQFCKTRRIADHGRWVQKNGWRQWN